MQFFTNFFNFLFRQPPDTTLAISIYEFQDPKDSGVFEIRLGKVIIICIEYNFKSSTIGAIKEKIDSYGVDLKTLQFDNIEFNNVSRYGQDQINEWIKFKS